MSAGIRKITALFLLILVLAPVSYIFVFQLRQQAIRHRMKERLEEQLLQSIVLDADQVHWFKPGKEIVINNRFFDVKEMEHLPDGTVRFTGLYDEEEDLLVERLMETQDEENSKGTEQIVSFFFQLQSLPCSDAEAGFPHSNVINRHHSFDDPKLPSPFRGIITPPPQA